MIDIIGHKEDNHDANGINDFPENFDARNHWFECVSISHIWNQGNCAADWVCIRFIVYSITMFLNIKMYY